MHICSVSKLPAQLSNKPFWHISPEDVGNGICTIDGDTLKDHNWTRGGYGKLTLKDAFVRKSKIAVRKAMKTAGVEVKHQQHAPIEMLQAYNEIIREGSLNPILT